MPTTLILEYLLLYAYFGLRFTLHIAIRYYKKYKNDYEKDDVRVWLAILIFWPVCFALYALFGQRGTAVRLALYYGLVPWQYYEKKKHYKGSYLRHALSNIGYALKWILLLESKADQQFEREVNNNF